MGHFYFVRHGQTVWNVENKICGCTDSPLTNLGRKQAGELGEKIRQQGIHADEILHSPLSRARETALEISRITGIPAREEKRIIEQNFGKWEGFPRDDPDFILDKRNFFTDYEGGESMCKVCQRIYNVIDGLKKEPDKVYLLVAHNGIARAVHSYFHSMSNDEYAAYGIPNCAIIRYDF